MEIHDLQNIIAKFRVAMPDPTELSCAKAIAFFKPGLYERLVPRCARIQDCDGRALSICVTSLHNDI